MPLARDIRAVVTDIEGTTTPISFVYETLFPFAEARLEQACARAAQDSRIAEVIHLLSNEYANDGETGLPEFGNGAAYARHLMGCDRKSTGLKALQGVIWEDGYHSGELRAQVFDDVPRALESWRRADVRLRVFSSGSVLAQKLLFAHTDHGDLTVHFEDYHDTTTGPKQESRSYRAIAEAFALPAGQVLYLSDIVAELDAAREAGMLTGMLVRPGNKPQPRSTHPVHADFLSLL